MITVGSWICHQSQHHLILAYLTLGKLYSSVKDLPSSILGHRGHPARVWSEGEAVDPTGVTCTTQSHNSTGQHVQPVRSKALATFSNSPDLLNLTSHTLTSGVKPEVATNLPHGDTLQQ